MTHYDIHPDLQKYARVKMIFSPKILPILNKLVDAGTKRVKLMDAIVCQEHELVTEEGSTFLIKIYKPAQVLGKRPAIIFYHGGGFTVKGSPHHKQLVMKLAHKLQCQVIWVEYTMAYVEPYPRAFNEAFSAYKWIVNHHEQLAIDQNKIAVCGDSAGGNLAAVVALKARDTHDNYIKGQMLLYPVTDSRQITMSIKKYEDTPIWNAKNNRQMWKLYVKSEEDLSSPYVAPILAKSHKDLPDTYIEVADYDCLHDEGVDYARCLQAANVKVELHQVKGSIHGYDIAVASDLVNDCMEKRVKFFTEIFK